MTAPEVLEPGSYNQYLIAHPEQSSDSLRNYSARLAEWRNHLLGIKYPDVVVLCPDQSIDSL